MTNFEKYKDEILEIANTSEHGFSLCDGKIEKCATASCEICKFDNNDCSCESAMLKWLYEEADAVDWTKVPVDAKVIVSQDGTKWYKRHFAKINNGKVYTFGFGKTSFSSEMNNNICDWQYAKLYEEKEQKND